MKSGRNILAKVGPLAALVLFTFAVLFVRKELRDVHYADLVASLRAIPLQGLLLSALSVAISYLGLTGIDTLGIRYAGSVLVYPRIALTSFIAFSVSNNFGFSAFTGGLIRYRLYTTFGVSPSQVVKVAGFCMITFWQGVLLLGGLALIWDPHSLPLPAFLHVNALELGLLLLAGFSAYALAAFLLKKPLRFGNVEVTAPTPALVLGQICVSILDWGAAGAALYFLLPAELQTGLGGFLAVFIISQTFGLVSNVPGGTGVFEASMLLLLPHQTPRVELFAALLAYRFAYYLAPLATAALLLSGFEIFQRRIAFRRGLSWFRPGTGPAATAPTDS